jgi:hypothetical protein
MIGRDHNQDRQTGAADEPGYDDIGAMGAGVLYEPDVKLKFLRAPQNLTASNKPSETNVLNMLPRIVVAQLAPQTQPRQLKKTVSRRIALPRNNQSLGGV